MKHCNGLFCSEIDFTFQGHPKLTTCSSGRGEGRQLFAIPSLELCCCTSLMSKGSGMGRGSCGTCSAIAVSQRSPRTGLGPGGRDVLPGEEDAMAVLHPGHAAGPRQDHARSITAQQDLGRSCQDCAGPLPGKGSRTPAGCQQWAAASPALASIPLTACIQTSSRGKRCAPHRRLSTSAAASFIQGAHWPLVVRGQILAT